MHLLLKLSLYLSLKVIASTPVHQTVQSQLLVASPTVLCNLGMMANIDSNKQWLCLEYATSYYTDYKEVETEECHTEYEKICVTETNVVCVDSSVTKCDLVHDTKCHTEYTQQCADKFKVEVEPYIETVCATLYKEECEHRWEGEGNEKVHLRSCRDSRHNQGIIFSFRSGFLFLEPANKNLMKSALM